MARGTGTTGGRGPVDTVFLGVFRRETVIAAGGFDAALERNQDYELNWRLRAGGGTVWFDPALAVAYRPRATLQALWRQYVDYGRWKRVVVRRHPRSLRLRQVVPPLATAGLGLSALGVPLAAALGGVAAAAAAGALPALYATVLAATTLVGLARRRDVAALLLPAVLAAMHLGWGFGFLCPAPARAGEPALTGPA